MIITAEPTVETSAESVDKDANTTDESETTFAPSLSRPLASPTTLSTMTATCRTAEVPGNRSGPPSCSMSRSEVYGRISQRKLRDTCAFSMLSA